MTVSSFVVCHMKGIPLDAELDFSLPFSLPFYSNGFDNDPVDVPQVQGSIYEERVEDGNRKLLELVSNDSTHGTSYIGGQTEGVVIGTQGVIDPDISHSNHTYAVEIALDGLEYYTPFNLFDDEVESVDYVKFIYNNPFEVHPRRLIAEGKPAPASLEDIASRIDLNNPAHVEVFSRLLDKYGEVAQIQQDKKMERLKKALFQPKRHELLYQYVKRKRLDRKGTR